MEVRGAPYRQRASMMVFGNLRKVSFREAYWEPYEAQVKEILENLQFGLCP